MSDIPSNVFTYLLYPATWYDYHSWLWSTRQIPVSSFTCNLSHDDNRMSWDVWGNDSRNTLWIAKMLDLQIHWQCDNISTLDQMYHNHILFHLRKVATLCQEENCFDRWLLLMNCKWSLQYDVCFHKEPTSWATFPNWKDFNVQCGKTHSSSSKIPAPLGVAKRHQMG